MDKYARSRVLGEGTYAVVYEAHVRDPESGEPTDQVVAIKRIHTGNAREGINFTALREVKLLQELQHPNIIELMDVFVHKENMNLVFEWLATDLEIVIGDTANVQLTPAVIKSLLQQTLAGVGHCHDSWILHRDLKPNNLMLAPNGVLKLGDFGLARVYASPNRRYTHQVVTLWYRAPELLFGARAYGPGVDVWAIGCIFAELMLRTPYLPGSSDIDQLGKIFAAMGTPSIDDWPEMTKLPSYVEFEEREAPPLRGLFSAASPAALDLLASFMHFDPNRRVSCADALEHAYFVSESPAPADPSEIPIPAPPTSTSTKHPGDSSDDDLLDHEADAENTHPGAGAKRGTQSPSVFESPSKRLKAIEAETGMTPDVKKKLNM